MKTEDAIRRAVADALGEPAWIGRPWEDPDPLPPTNVPLYRAIYAFPTARVAGLAHWRDEVELIDAHDHHIVAMEAAKWARLALKRHRLALGAGDRDPTLVELAELCREQAPFSTIDTWLAACRQKVIALADATRWRNIAPRSCRSLQRWYGTDARARRAL